MGIIDGAIDLPHHSRRLHECDDHLLISLDIFPREYSSLAILEPLLSGLISSYGEIPYYERHIVEVLSGINPDLSHRRKIPLSPRDIPL